MHVRVCELKPNSILFEIMDIIKARPFVCGQIGISQNRCIVFIQMNAVFILPNDNY